MIVRGWASTSTLDHYRHVVVASAFNEAIRDKGLTGPGGIRLLWQHERKNVLGRITKLEPRNRGLWMEAEIDESISFGKDVAQMIRVTDGLNFSVGFFLLDADIMEAPDGRDFLHITKGDLEEISVVTFPGQAEATIVEWEDD